MQGHGKTANERQYTLMTALMLFTAAWVCGILLSYSATVPLPWLLITIPTALVMIIGWGDTRWIRRGAAMLCALLLGAGRLVLAQPTIDENHVAFYTSIDSVTVPGVLTGEGEINSTRPVVKMKALTVPGNNFEQRSIRGNILVTFPPYSDVNYGERVQVEGILKTPSEFETFSYRTYLAHQNIYTVLDATHYRVITPHQANIVKETLLLFQLISLKPDY